MATRSKIGYLDLNGTIRSIYCHWDGYPQHVGRMLLTHYNHPSKIEPLIALGHLSSLGSKLGEKHPFSWHDGNISAMEHEKLYGDWCCAYGRDRGESNTQANHHNSMMDFERCEAGEEYLYLWHPLNLEWRCKHRGRSEWRSVADVLLDKE